MTVEVPINVYNMMKKYKDENRSFMSFMEGLVVDADIWGWVNYPKYGSKEELLMEAWLNFGDVKALTLYCVELPELVTTDGKQQYLSYADNTFFACRRNKLVQQFFTLDQIPDVYYSYVTIVKGGKDDAV